jgi:hypothetical protein
LNPHIDIKVSKYTLTYSIKNVPQLYLYSDSNDEETQIRGNTASAVTWPYYFETESPQNFLSACSSNKHHATSTSCDLTGLLLKAQSGKSCWKKPQLNVHCRGFLIWLSSFGNFVQVSAWIEVVSLAVRIGWAVPWRL